MGSASGTIGSTREVGNDPGERCDHSIVVGCIIARDTEDLGKLVCYYVHIGYVHTLSDIP